MVKSKGPIISLTGEQLLNAISLFLDGDGGLKSVEDCVKFNNCMKQLGVTVEHICLFLNVINSTHDEAVLSKLLSLGAWATLHEWLSEFKELNETPVLVLLLETFQNLPVSMEMLKANSTAKIIKGLSKHTDEEIKQKSAATVDKWMQLIKSKTGGSSPAHSHSSSKNGEHKEKKKKKHKSSEKSELKPKIKSPPHSSEHLNTDVPSPPPPTIFKEGSKSDSERTTAKQHNVKERSAGVEAGVIKPKPRGSKPAKSTPAAKPLVSAASSSQKRTNIELAGSSDIRAEMKKPKIDINKEEDFGKAKLIAPLPKPAHVQDSDGFMAALLQPRTPVTKKKRSVNRTPTSPTSPPQTPVSPVVAPPSFYKDTFEGPSGVSPPHPSGHSSSDRTSPVESTVSSLSNPDDVKNEPMDTSVTKSAKKRVSWKADKELKQYHYFELLEDERVNVNRIRDQGGFDEMKKREMMSDREALKSLHMDDKGSLLQHSNALPSVTENFKWARPLPLDLLPTKFEPGHLSQQRQVQSDREVKVLAALYFTKAAVPPSASEPDHIIDMEPTDTLDPPTIPLEVENSQSHQPTANFEPEVQHAPMDTLVRAGTNGTHTVSDLVPGVTANDMDLIQKLANGDASQEILEALANTSPDYLNKIMQTEGMNADVPPPRFQPQGGMPPFNMPPPNFNGPMGPYGGYNGPAPGGFRGPRPFHNSGFRGSWNNNRGGRGRGRGNGMRGRGRPTKECTHFQRLGKCDYGDTCSFLHTVH